ncbi:MAG TPA: hypothetical protein VJP76_01525 [Candidatus Tumulicola sp.]|nr:hypothetical protein [Candidatus Tumulicola sp.]
MALVGLAVLLRIAFYVPLALFPLDSDGVLAGLCAFRIEAGQHPFFFPGGSRLSSASCYVAATFFHLVGPSRFALGLTGLFWAILTFAFVIVFLRTVLPPTWARVSFLFAAVAPEQVVTVTYIPWAYGEILASCGATLSIAALYHARQTRWLLAALGVSIGLGLWFSLQTLMVAIPTLIWLARLGVLRQRGSMPLGFGLIVGSSPFWVGNIVLGFPSILHNWASRPSSPNGILDNAVYLVTTTAPGLLFHGFTSWHSAVIIFGYILLSIGIVLSLRRESADRSRALVFLATLIALFAAALFCFSQAGSMRGWTVRYILPMFFAALIYFGVGASALWRRSKAVAVLACVAVILPNLFLYSLPGSIARNRLTNALEEDARLRNILASRGVEVLYGDYFLVYHENFDSRETLKAIPAYDKSDYLNYRDSISQKAARVAMLGSLQDVTGWAKLARVRGTVQRLDGGQWLFVSSHAIQKPRLFVRLLQRNCNIGSCLAPFPD